MLLGAFEEVPTKQRNLGGRLHAQEWGEIRAKGKMGKGLSILENNLTYFCLGASLIYNIMVVWTGLLLVKTSNALSRRQALSCQLFANLPHDWSPGRQRGVLDWRLLVLEPI